MNPLGAMFQDFFQLTSSWVGVAMAIALEFFVFLILILFTDYFEKKLAADMENRVGPNRFGPWGALHGLGHVFSLITLSPVQTSRANSRLIPIVILACGFATLFLSVAAVPFSHQGILVNFPSTLWVSVLALFFCDAVTILIGAFSKKDRSLEESSQYLSLWACYALPFFLGVFALVLAYGDDSVAGLIAQQSGLPWHWNISRHVAGIPAFLSVYGAILIWTREQKVGFDFGFYGSELLLLALLAKGRWFFMHFLLVSLFLGGWVFPFSLGFLGQGSNFIEFSFVLGKTLLAMAASILILRSFPRLNIDLAVRWGWTVLVPLGFLSLLLSLLPTFFWSHP